MANFLEKHDLKVQVVLSKVIVPKGSSETGRNVYQVSICKQGSRRLKKGKGGFFSSGVYEAGRKITFTIIKENSPRWLDIVNLLPLFPPVTFPPTAENKERLKDWNEVLRFFTANELRDIRALSSSTKNKILNRKPLISRLHSTEDEKVTVQIVDKIAPEARSPLKFEVTKKTVMPSFEVQKQILSLKKETVLNQKGAIESWLQEHIDSTSSLVRLTTSGESNLEGALPSGERVKVDRRTIQSTLSKISHRTFQTTLQSGKSSTQIKKDKKFNFESPKDLTCYLTELVEKQKHRCALTGIFMQPEGSAESENFQYSLDRIDSTGHYERGNLQMVCRFANRWKSDSNDAEFKCLILAVKLDGV